MAPPGFAAVLGASAFLLGVNAAAGWARNKHNPGRRGQGGLSAAFEERGTQDDDEVEVVVKDLKNKSCFLSCNVFNADDACQCNPKCASRRDCCDDYGTYCLPNRKHSYIVGEEVTAWLLVWFWLAAGAIFVVFLLPAMYICRPSPVHKETFASGGHRMGLEDSDRESASDLGGHLTSMAPGHSDCKYDKYEIHGSWWCMHFVDPVLEKQWDRETISARLGAGAKAAIGALIAVVCLLLMRWETKGHVTDLRAWPGIGVGVTVILFAPLVACFAFPNTYLFWSCVIFIYLWLPSLNLPPLSLSCYDLHLIAGQRETLKVDAPWLYHAVQLVDCSLPGISCMQVLMLWILFTPWIMPQTEHIHATWFWIVGVFLCWTVTYAALTEDRVFDPGEVMQRVAILACTQVVSTIIKYSLETTSRRNWAQDLKHKDEAMKLFCILEYMMPKHVIGPMLMDTGPIGEFIEEVSIMFVLIADFEKFTRSSTPNQLLKFLNAQFTVMDKICAKHKVTKIETVGEEFVAAVGVLPSDIELFDRQGHAPLLHRLASAADEILHHQTEEVRFKVGIHTGPIVAGVIGTKLPRFRLFGDTINSAARMMQKARPGKLQFGMQTHECLSEHFKSSAADIGAVEMKGKGRVRTFEYSPDVVARVSRNSKRKDTSCSGSDDTSFRRMSLLHAMAAPTDMLANEECVRSRFDSCLVGVARPDRPNKCCILGEYWSFDREADAEWFAQFHRDRFMAGVSSRLGAACLLSMVMAGFEMHSMIKSQIWIYPHQVYKKRFRLPFFVFSRGLAIFLFMFWWWACSPGPTCGWSKRHPRTTQWLMVLSTMIVVVMLFVGYDALTYSESPQLEERVFWSIPPPFRAPDDSIIALHFLVCYLVLMHLHPVPFHMALLYVLLTLMLWRCADILQFFGCWDPAWDKTLKGPLSANGIMLLFAQTMLCVLLAHDEENSSRKRFKAQRVLDWTHNRTTDILGTLMPPLVVEALSRLPPNAPPPTDSYRHATIAQSDLCGFTVLASQKSPEEVVKCMSELFGAFDKLVDIHKVYKVETVGDAYIAGVAERPLTHNNSPISVIIFALDMVRVVDEWSEKLNANVTCRVGVAYGECIGGIVGNDMLRYHLFGDLLVMLDIAEVTFVERRGPLRTSKGETHDFAEVGGATYLVESNRPLRRR